MRDINLIVVHCSASKEGQDLDVHDMDRIHKRRGWSGVGYNYVIKLDGEIQKGRDLEKIPAHVRGFNRNSIGVCYIGGVDQNNKPKDTRTEKQKDSLLFLLMELKQRFPMAEIVGHRDLSPDLNGDGEITRNEWTKACPCFDAKTEYADILI